LQISEFLAPNPDYAVLHLAAAGGKAGITASCAGCSSRPVLEREQPGAKTNVTNIMISQHGIEL
jgi:hypothetical protein